MGNLDLYNKVRVVPEEAKKTIQGGRLKGMTDINPMWRIKALTEQFGVCGIGWYYEVIEKWIETVHDERVAFVNINMFIKVNGEWSMPIFGTGGSKLATIEKGSLYVSDECFKMATTDAISVACKQLGMGADVYWDKDNTKYTTATPKTEKTPEEAVKEYNDKPATAKQIMELTAELNRTGANIEPVLVMYKCDNITQLTQLQCSKSIETLKRKPDKAK